MPSAARRGTSEAWWDLARQTADGVGCAGRRGQRGFRLSGAAASEAFGVGPVRRFTGTQAVQPALVEANHERVARDSSAGRVGQGGCEISPGSCAECFASTKPEQRIAREALTKSVERPMVHVSGPEQVAIERLSVDECVAPLAVAPKLEFGDRSRRLVTREPGEGVREAARAIRAVDAAECAVQPSAVLPAEPQRTRGART